MPAYRIGATGPEVARIQQQLTRLGFYNGPIDGSYGGGTYAAVHTFQRARGIEGDGVVGPRTWSVLFDGSAIPAPAVAAEPLATRCLALTASFETESAAPECFAGLAGDFDGMGMSFGVLQWNVGSGSLPPLLQSIDAEHPGVLDAVFQERASELRRVLASSRVDQLAWARSIQDPATFRLSEPWRGMFKTLGRRPECIGAQTAAASERYRRALAMCADYGLWSERAAALMFDVVVQNGGILDATRARIESDFAAIPDDSRDEREVARMVVVANRRAEAARPQFVEDVRQRKLTIARGEGTVHGRHYDLAEDFGIVLRPISATPPEGVMATSVASPQPAGS
jgi:hypothetical protein